MTFTVTLKERTELCSEGNNDKEMKGEVFRRSEADNLQPSA